MITNFRWLTSLQFALLELGCTVIRTNHLHAVVSTSSKPEIIINGFKSHATRKLKENFLIDKETKVWSRGGSNRYLWKKNHVDAAIDYVLYSQGLLPFEIKRATCWLFDRLNFSTLVRTRVSAFPNFT